MVGWWSMLVVELPIVGVVGNIRDSNIQKKTSKITGILNHHNQSTNHWIRICHIWSPSPKIYVKEKMKLKKEKKAKQQTCSRHTQYSMSPKKPWCTHQIDWGAAPLLITTPHHSLWQNHLYYGYFPKYSGTPKSSILIGFSIINHQFWGTPIFGNTHIIFPNLSR